MDKKLILPVIALVMSVIALFASLVASHEIWPACTRYRAVFPQSAEEVSKLYGIDVNRITMWERYDCMNPHNLAYWSFQVDDGPEVTMEVPEGGEIIVYAGKSFDEMIGKPSNGWGPGRSFTSGWITGTRIFVLAEAIDYSVDK